MNIRSLTGFLSLSDPLPASALKPLQDLVAAGRESFAKAGFPVQTARVATQPIPEIAPRDLTQFALDLQAAAQVAGVPDERVEALAADQGVVARATVHGQLDQLARIRR